MSYQSFATGVFTLAELRKQQEQAAKSANLVALGQRIRARRRGLELDRRQLAERCGIAADRLGRFEHGLSDIDFISLDKLCHLLNMDTVSLLAEFMHVDRDKAQVTIDLARPWAQRDKPLMVADLIDQPIPWR